MPELKPKMFRLDTYTETLLKLLATHHGDTMTDVVRHAIREKAARDLPSVPKVQPHSKRK